MPSRIIYLPLESYGSRYTQHTDCVDGSYETGFKELGINFLAIRPDNKLYQIKHGLVLDVVQRTEWGFKQTLELVRMIMDGEIDPKEDVIYMSDFFHPGFEMIMYAQSSKFGPNPRDHAKVYSFCLAQSFDPYDFTHHWQWWMRPIEKLWFEYQDRVFCAAREMLPLIADAGIPIIKDHRYKIIPVGHVFNKKVMLRVAGVEDGEVWAKRTGVIWTSRFDAEKNPNFFMDLIENVLEDGRKDIPFYIATGRHDLTSNNPKLIERLLKLKDKYSNHIFMLKDLNSNLYYTALRHCKVQFNCALQDWISYTLLDSCINGCLPLYPKYLTFTDALENDERFLYNNLDLKDAKKKLYALIDTEDHGWSLSFVYNKYESTVKKIVQCMGFQINDSKTV